MSARRNGKRTARVAIAVAAVLAAASVAVVVTGFGLPDSDSEGAAQSELPPETAEVTKQTLVDTQTEDGELSYGDDTTLNGRIAGTVTALPVPGSVADRGQTLYRVDDTPVVLMVGALPAYRALAPDVEGADVKQFEENLSALGYGGFDVDEEYTESTADAVSEWQEDLGLEETGTVELGRVIYAASAVRVDTLQVAVGDATQPGEALFTYTGTSRVVVVELDVSDQRLAVDGAAVSVTLPDGTTVPGKITKTETVVETSSDSGTGSPGEDDSSESETKIEVTITPDDPKALDGLEEAAVDVNFTASQRENVLTVPVAALLALAEGGYGVEVVDGSTTRIVAVETGLFASGQVEVSGEGLTEGTTVGMPS